MVQGDRCLLQHDSSDMRANNWWPSLDSELSEAFVLPVWIKEVLNGIYWYVLISWILREATLLAWLWLCCYTYVYKKEKMGKFASNGRTHTESFMLICVITDRVNIFWYNLLFNPLKYVLHSHTHKHTRAIKKTCKHNKNKSNTKLTICHSSNYSSICNLLHNMIRHQRWCTCVRVRVWVERMYRYCTSIGLWTGNHISHMKMQLQFKMKANF